MDWEDSEEFQELRKEDILDLNSGTRLSFENPNYFLSEVTARLNDTLNSNTAGNESAAAPPKHRRRRSMSAEDSSSEEDEDEQHPELAVESGDSSEEEELEITSDALAANFPPRSARSDVNRTRYARLNPEAMGVNLDEGPVPSIPHGCDNEPKPMETDNDDIPPQADHSKRTPLWEAAIRPPKSDDLPFGWEKRESPGQGVYYFHTGTGISQKERPKPVIFRAPRGGVGMRRPVSMNLERLAAGDSFRRSMTSSTLAEFAGCGKPANRSNSFNNCDDKWKRNSLPPSAVIPSSCRFMVRSLGSLEIPEDELTPEKSSKAVNRCIVGLSSGSVDGSKEPLIGDGEDLYLDLDDSSLKLTAIDKEEVLVSQPIHTIRVWGVGRDNGRDFAYVAKNRATRKYVCHVFRCDGPARVIANGLRDICKRIMIERNHGGGSSCLLHSSPGGKPRENSATSSPSSVVHAGPRRPTSLAVEGSTRNASKSAQIASILQTFPTPMDEPRKVMKVVYVGSQEVSKPSGMDVLHGAIDYLTATIPMDQWIPVTVAVAPSTITVSTAKDPLDPIPREQIEFECRVRFLSFLGIGKNIVYCGFIVHTAQEKFISHIFCCEPSSATLCRTIEAACKLRYQKCMDAHGPRTITQQQQKTTNPVTTPGSIGSAKSSADSAKAGETIRSALKSMIGTIASATTKRIKSFDSS